MAFLSASRLQSMALIAQHIAAARRVNAEGVKTMRFWRKYGVFLSNPKPSNFTQRDLHMAAARNLLEQLK